MEGLSAIALAALAAAGCESNREIFYSRQEMHLFAENAQRAYHAGQYDRAVHQAKKALEVDGDLTKALTILGYTYMQVARFAETRETRLEYLEMAEKELDHAVMKGSETDPAVFKAYFGLGLVYFIWAQEVKGMMERTGDAGIVPECEGEGEGGAGKELWSE